MQAQRLRWSWGHLSVVILAFMVIASSSIAQAASAGAQGTPELPDSAPLSAEERAALAPNELGVIPVLQYHLFTSDPAAEDQLTRPIEDFWADLQWLYDNNFYVISMADFVRNEIDAPAGKHPVVLSFDDATAGQFRLLEQEDGSLMVDPESAVGVMEMFYRAHPDFGRGGFFAMLNFNCFAIPTEPDQMQYCNRKIEWLAENGYEVGNHTIGHEDLLDVTDEEFRYQLGELWNWIDANVPAPGALPSVIAMPYGNYPDRDTHQPQRQLMYEGFEYEGEFYQLEGALMVGAEPAPSPSSAEWDHIWIPRIQAFDDELERWLPQFENGGVILYTSDGNPETVTVPDPLSGWLDGALDPDLIAASGKTLIQYGPGTGEPTGAISSGITSVWQRRPAA